VTVSVAHLRKKDFQSELSHTFGKWGAKGWGLVKFEPVLESGLFAISRTGEFIAIFKRLKL
jgi:hypothetical protein